MALLKIFRMLGRLGVFVLFAQFMTPGGLLPVLPLPMSLSFQFYRPWILVLTLVSFSLILEYSSTFGRIRELRTVQLGTLPTLCKPLLFSITKVGMLLRKLVG